MSEELNVDIPSASELARSSKTSSKSKSSRGDDEGRGEDLLGDRAPQAYAHMSEDDMVARFRNESSGSILPDLSTMLADNPYFQNRHVLWLTTTNPRDSVHARLRLGYELITLEMAPEMTGFSNMISDAKDKYEGFCTVNEMIGASIPRSLYEKYMFETHAQAPFEEQRKITGMIDQLNESASRIGGGVSEGDGFSELRRTPGRVKFS